MFAMKHLFISLRYLNLAQNKIEKLPTSLDFEEESTLTNKRHSRSSFTKEKGYCAPLLEELYLQVSCTAKNYT